MTISSIKEKFNIPIDIAGLVYFRIFFGLMMLIEVIRYFNHDWIKRYFIDPEFYFSYDGFTWISPWSGDGMYYHFIFLGIIAFFIGIGFLYRISTILFFLAFNFIFLIDKTNYLNHFYLISLLSFILIFLPSNRAFSIDAILFSKIRTNWVPNWTVWWIRLQLGIVYFYGGIAKINGDWLQCEPMRKWLASRTDFPILGQWFTEEWMIHLFSYGGLFLDLLIFPLLVCQRTRVTATILITVFHLLNSKLFDIGIFPWFMIGSTAIFFPPETLRVWPKAVDLTFKKFNTSNMVICGLGLYFIIQATVPLRHLLYDGNVSWTEEGHRFAWHMKLRSKSASTTFTIVDSESNKSRVVKLSDYLSKRQRKKMKKKPDMIVQFAQHLAKKESQNGRKNSEIYVHAKCGLNGRTKVDLINPSIDLSKVTYPFYKQADWIMPLDIPLSH